MSSCCWSGNADSYAGNRLALDYGPLRIAPSIQGSASFVASDNFGWYVFLGAEARAVARNLFLDGNTFRDSRSVEKKNLVGDLQWGLTLAWPAVRLSYTHVLRSPEFIGQKGGDDFGAFLVSIPF